ncbi:MAG: M20/M25/M40 family metallo-hydrolase [Elusimicrobia bacterium]|nr:M20/M25/M40 family metallo-hydrolase [Elusimicrobiota bacterium]
MRTSRAFGALLLAAACAAPAPKTVPGQDAAAGISTERMLSAIRELSSDAYEGRAPGTRGERKTVATLTERFRSLGVEPGNRDGTYAQDVPLRGITSDARVFFTNGEKTYTPQLPTEATALSRRPAGTTVEESEVVFVGYGVRAPEWKWDDYKGIDLRGKTLIMLVGDPAVADPKNPSLLDEKTFKGRAMTYYGRWTYKYEIAGELGAAAAFIVHETGPAGYPYEVVSGSFGREQFDLRLPSSGPARVQVEGWLHVDTARKLFGLGGRDFDKLKGAAARRDFRPEPLGLSLSARVVNETRDIDSANVVAKIVGRDPDLLSELVIYTAHWDHLGVDDKRAGDKVFNGAVDNATGLAAMLEIAAAFKRLPRPPRRSILFLAPTAEEKGLLGAKYYVERPLHSLAKTVALLNMDSLNVWGPTSDLSFLGLEHSTLDRWAEASAAEDGRALRGDPEPEKGLFFRSDHFPFAKAGVPALNIQAGVDVMGEVPGWGRRKREEYTAHDYHKVSDEPKPGWDLRGMAQDARVMFRIGLAVAESDRRPEWKSGSEFRRK